MRIVARRAARETSESLSSRTIRVRCDVMVFSRIVRERRAGEPLGEQHEHLALRSDNPACGSGLLAPTMVCAARGWSSDSPRGGVDALGDSNTARRGDDGALGWS